MDRQQCKFEIQSFENFAWMTNISVGLGILNGNLNAGDFSTFFKRFILKRINLWKFNKKNVKTEIVLNIHFVVIGPKTEVKFHTNCEANQ